MLHALGLLALLHAFLALVLHALGLLALLGSSGLSLAVVALLVGGLVAGLAVLVVLALVFFLDGNRCCLYLLSVLSRHCTNGKDCNDKRQ